MNSRRRIDHPLNCWTAGAAWARPAFIWHRRALDQVVVAMQNIIRRVILVFAIARDAEILDLAAGMQSNAPAARRNLSAAPVLRRRLSSGCVEMHHLFW
jgi:hypothetical protein